MRGGDRNKGTVTVTKRFAAQKWLLRPIALLKKSRESMVVAPKDALSYDHH